MAENLQLKLAFTGDLHTLEQRVHLAFARGAREAAERHLAAGKLKLRADVRGAGLGDRLANVWRAEIYPRSANVRTHNPAVVFRVNDRAKTKRSDSLGNVATIASAADIITAHTIGPTISSKNGLYMALPTSRTPRKGRRYATPTEVEEMFNQDLKIIPGRGQQLLAFVDGIKGRNGQGYRPPTKGRQRGGRKPELILVFVLLRQVRLRAKLRWPQIFKELERDWPNVVATELAKTLGET
jgi:hypothetical protein